MRLLVFGTGKFYSNRKKYIKDEIVAFIDNKVENTAKFEDKIVLHPSRWKSVDFDKVVLMSAHQQDMKSQLMKLGVNEDLILTWEDYFYILNARRIDLFIHDARQGRRKVLVFTESLNHNGGSLAAVYAVMALKQKGYEVWLAGAFWNANDIFISEIGQLGINIAMIYDCPYLREEDLYWIKKFDIVIVNVFQMLKCACDISAVRPVLWWLHEPDFVYGPILNKFPDCSNPMKLKNMHIVAVSDLAKECFKNHFPDVDCGTMAYGIPDERGPLLEPMMEKKYIFAIIGGVSHIKGQDLFLKAAERMVDTKFLNIEFWIIGNIGSDEYSRKIHIMAEKNPNVKIWGNLNRKDINKAFGEIDVVVSASRQDCLPIVLAEGMMHEKICITSNSTGMVKYITDGENGFVFESENVEMLNEKMRWVFLHRYELNDVKKRARDTYERFFSMEAFGGRLEEELIHTEKSFLKF